MEPPRSLEPLREWVSVGGTFRSRPDDAMPGRCGGVLEREKSEAVHATVDEQLPYCGRLAGWGTDHPRIGRCKFHENDFVHGLPVWIGELSAEMWAWISNGAARVQRESGMFAVERVRRSFEAFIRDALDQDDRDVFDTVVADPVVMIDQELKLIAVMAVRLLRWTKQRQFVIDGQTQYVSGPSRDPGIVEAEHQLQRLALIKARLLEVRARYSELEDSRRSADEVTKLLQTMNNDDFGALRRDPSLWARIANKGSGPQPGSDFDA